jgi:hypothetical protein
MTNKNLLYLLLSAFLYVVIAIGAFVLAEQNIRNHDLNRDREDQQKFDRFVENVKSGKRQLTPDQWLEGMRLGRNQIESERHIGLQTTEAMRTGAWWILVGAAFQVFVIFSIRKGCTKQL